MLPKYAPSGNESVRLINCVVLYDLALSSFHPALALRTPQRFLLVLKHASGGVDIDVKRVGRLSLPEDDIAAGKLHRAEVSNELDLPY